MFIYCLLVIALGLPIHSLPLSGGPTLNARQNQADQCPASDVIGYADTCSVPADFWSYGPVEIPPPPDSIKPPPNAAFTSFAQLVSTPGGGEFRCPADGAISYNDECVVQQPNDVWKMATKPQKDSGIKLQMEFDAKNSCPYGRIQDHEFMDGHQGNATLLAIWQDLNKASNDDWIDYIEAKVEAVLDSNAKNFKSTWGLDFYEFSKIAGSDVDYKTYNDSGNKRRSTDLAVRQNEGTGNFLRALGNSKDLFVGTVCFVGLVAITSTIVSYTDAIAGNMTVGSYWRAVLLQIPTYVALAGGLILNNLKTNWRAGPQTMSISGRLIVESAYNTITVFDRFSNTLSQWLKQKYPNILVEVPTTKEQLEAIQRENALRSDKLLELEAKFDAYKADTDETILNLQDEITALREWQQYANQQCGVAGTALQSNPLDDSGTLPSSSGYRARPGG